ncbi:paramyosin-like isoform X2 [Leptopilina boulardi]|uniref:paramyosin-like isoform X2 n=1 Tax=Leptopilina boulardi TaxID=63433 RepID=UPI0021F55343|nr:paramyosin-like isoform X2 [Leptopilina boulardi]
MTDVLLGLVSNGFYNSETSINKDVFKTNSKCIYSEMRHSKSEDLFNPMSRPPTPVTAVSEELIACTPCTLLTETTGSNKIDPVDSIRDIVSENDLYRFVLFKRHYDKYVALSTKYEEEKGMVYYLEERYIELKAERDKLEQTSWMLEKKLEGCELELREKEEELFLQLERSLRLEDEIERVKIDRDTCKSEYDQLERDQAGVLRQLQLHTAQNEITRRSLERARQEVIKQATIIREERDALEQENEVLKEKLRLEQNELGAERLRREEGIAALTQEAVTLRHTARHMRAAALHATACRSRRRCSVCIYAKRTFAEVDDFRNEFSSEIGDRRSRSYECGSSHKSESCNSENTQRQPGLQRSKWTSSIRKLLNRKSKTKTTVSQS